MAQRLSAAKKRRSERKKEIERKERAAFIKKNKRFIKIEKKTILQDEFKKRLRRSRILDFVGKKTKRPAELAEKSLKRSKFKVGSFGSTQNIKNLTPLEKRKIREKIDAAQRRRKKRKQ